MSAEATLKAKGITLPPPSMPLANYVGAVGTGNLLYLSGHGPMRGGKPLATGKVGRDLTVEQGYSSASSRPLARPSATSIESDASSRCWAW